MSDRRDRSKRISPPASQSTVKNAQSIDSSLKDSLNNSLKIRSTALSHHNCAYWIVVVIFVWLMILVYVPLSVLVFRAVFSGDFERITELIRVIAQKELGIVLAVLCVIPIYLLSGLLKYNRIDVPQDASEGDNIFPNIMPGP